VDRLKHGLIVHHPYAPQTEDVGDFVRIDEHPCRPVRQDGADELGHRDHSRLDVHVPVEKAGHQIPTAGLDDLGPPADGVARVFPDVGDPASAHSNVRVVDDLARLHANPAAVTNDKVGRMTSHGDIDQAAPQLLSRSHIHGHLSPGSSRTSPNRSPDA
jgi:hypothetical protein